MLKRCLSMFVALCAMVCLLSAHAAPSTGEDSFYIEVDLTNQITTVFQSSDRSIVRQMICSTGLGNYTPRGTFRLEKSRSSDRKAWYYIPKYGCYVKYPTRIQGPILFHSIPYSARDMGSIDPQALAELGTKASHGCIRLRWQDAMWIAGNCPDGTRVRIFNGAARKNPLRRLLLDEGFSIEKGLSYDQFIADGSDSSEIVGIVRGATGSEVTALQRRLIGLGFMRGEASDVYDSATVIAVMRCQSASGQRASGIATASRIDQILSATGSGGDRAVRTPSAADAQRADVSRGGRTTGLLSNVLNALHAARRAFGEHVAPTVGNEDMSRGSVGEGVVMLQERLRALGFYNGARVPLYGAGTARAVADYQLAAGLTPSGDASVELQNRIFADDAITGTCVPLAHDTVSPAAATLQRALSALQYYDGPCDGHFDEETAQAVRLFTRTNGMPESDEATPEIQAAAINQYLDCEARFGSGNYVLNLVGVESRVAKIRSKTPLYSQKRTDSEPLLDLRRGARATVLEESGDWCRIRVRGRSGYVRTEHLAFSTRISQVAEFVSADAPTAMAFGEDDEPEVAAPHPAGDDEGAAAPDYNGIAVEEFEEIAEESETIAVDEEAEGASDS